MENTKKTILVVEEKGDWRDLLIQVIERSGYEVINVNKPEDIPEAIGACPDLILLDLGLVREGAENLVTQLQKNSSTRHIPIVCEAIYGVDCGIDRVISAGAKEVLYKPFDLSDLPSILRQNLGR